MNTSRRDYTASLGKLCMTDAPGAGGRGGEPTGREGRGKREWTREQEFASVAMG